MGAVALRRLRSEVAAASACAVSAGAGDHVKAGDRSSPPARAEACTVGIVPSFSKSGLRNASVSGPARFGEFQARPDSPSRRLVEDVSRTVIDCSLLGKACDTGGQSASWS
jgi:hypothetical protein